jgi:ATP-dependent Clp protease ATP-binding subunit ClpA
VSERLDIRKTMTEARLEARDMGSSRIEAEHVLLVLASHPQAPAGRLLAAQGLDRAALRRAIDLEFENSLAGVGVRLADFFALPTAPALEGPRAMGQSCRLAIQRAMQARTGRGRARRLGSLHLLLGILKAEGGTAVRALAAIDVDRAELAARVRAELEQAA